MKNSFNYNKNTLSNYDENFNVSFLFENELIENQEYIKIRKNRYVINKESLNKYIYISNISVKQTQHGYLIENASDSLLLNVVGENICLLSVVNISNQLNLYSMLYSFMYDFDYVIDISKFKFYFKNIYIVVPLFKKH